jgi:hypothetical protein
MFLIANLSGLESGITDPIYNLRQLDIRGIFHGRMDGVFHHQGRESGYKYKNW